MGGGRAAYECVVRVVVRGKGGLPTLPRSLYPKQTQPALHHPPPARSPPPPPPVFTGSGFDQVIREALSQGPQCIEDCWLKFFCVR